MCFGVFLCAYHLENILMIAFAGSVLVESVLSPMHIVGSSQQHVVILSVPPAGKVCHNLVILQYQYLLLFHPRFLT